VSDVDLFVVIRRVEARWGGDTVSSATVLRRIRDDLADRFPLTETRRDAQAVVVHFRQGHRPVDIVPAFFLRMSAKGYPIYLIPDGEGGWMESAPEAHAAYLKRCDERCGSKLKRGIRLLKWWAHSRTPSIPLRSFHAELVLAATQLAVGARTYSQIMRDAIWELYFRDGAALRDPLGISGLVSAASTDVRRASLVNSLEHAYGHAQAAVAAEEKGRGNEAIRQWDIVFNGTFPA